MAKKNLKIIKVRVFTGATKSFDETGKQNGESQLVSLVHDSTEWLNFLKFLKANRYNTVKVEKVLDKASGDCIEKGLDVFQEEVDKSFAGAEAPISDSEKLAKLSAQMEEMVKGGKKGVSDKEVKSQVKEAVKAAKAESDKEIAALKKQLEEANKPLEESNNKPLPESKKEAKPATRKSKKKATDSEMNFPK